MNASLNHVNIILNDVEAARDFFVRYFGFIAGEKETLTGKWADTLNRMHDVQVEHIPMKLNDRILELQRFISPPSPGDGKLAEPNRPGYRHLGFNVDNIDAAVEQLKAGGCQFLSDVQSVPNTTIRTVYFLGPEGILLQLTQQS